MLKYPIAVFYSNCNMGVMMIYVKTAYMQLEIPIFGKRDTCNENSNL